jgi:hypothetical protein
MFFIDKDDPYHPRLLNTAPTLGEFPSAVAYSSRLKTACVINGGAVGGVSCFSTDHAEGLTPVGGLRPIALGQVSYASHTSFRYVVSIYLRHCILKFMSRNRSMIKSNS